MRPIYVEVARGEEEKERERESRSLQESETFLLSSRSRDPDTWGQRRLNGFLLKRLPRTRTHADADERARANYENLVEQLTPRREAARKELI
ncbi:hypothetical protein EPR50_G00238770 [Perca flavescens]|uniref:Uncharacterized protein n=1 Tax=Perca flavescens TaxID=8167 RepID=A0A484C2U5_PERFV|nr:hypothetical protein EPR50_G00238770 [Perca flavescens]